MQNLKYKIAVFLLITLFFGLVPNSQAVAQSTSVPRCQLYVYLPAINNGSGNMNQVIQQETEVQTNHLFDKPDFNGDGCADLAIGVPSETVITSNYNNGAVQVVYGSTSGLTAAGNQLWHRGGGYTGDGSYLGDIQGESTDSEYFGAPLATGDFDQDGYTDLAIGVPWDKFGDHDDGVVQVLYGSSDGLLAAGNQYWSQDGGWVDENGDGEGSFIGDIYGGAEPGDRFGGALASGDFNQDGYADLAIGATGEAINSNNLTGAGVVNVLFGSEDGLTWVGNQMWSQDFGVQEVNGTNTYIDLGDLIGVAEGYDRFGSSLAVGDFDHDGYDDLVIGVSAEYIGKVESAGVIHILKGSETGLTAARNQHVHQKEATLDTDGDGEVDEIIGDPKGEEEEFDLFGYSLAAGDFNGDTFDDLAVGVPGESVFVNQVEISDAGATQVFYGTEDGLTLTGEQWWQQDGETSLGHMFGSPPEQNDLFGFSLATGDMNGDGYHDLVIGAPYQDISEIGNQVGSVNVIYGSQNGLDLPNHLWVADIVIGDDGTNLGALVGTPTHLARFGFALTTADLNNDGYDDLALGMPRFTPQGSNAQSGAVSIMLGTRNGLTVSGNQLWDQDGGWDDQGHYLGDLYDETDTDEEFGGALPNFSHPYFN